MSENKQTTDSELLLQIVGYNAEAFEQLYNRYSATIYSFIKEIVSSPKLAEKIMLNVFSVFLKRIEYYSTTDNNVFTYLSLLTRNIALDVFKRMKFVEDIPIYSDEYEIEFILPNLSSKISPINLDEKIILGEKIKEYKSHLTEVQNLVLSLVYFEGLNEGEIAKRLNVPIVTVRQKIITIMANLHQQYTGRAAENNNNNKEILNLVKLQSLGCLSSEETMLLNQLRKNDPDFPWGELGEYQNLTALLSAPISIEPLPHDLKSEIRTIFTKILQGNEVDYPIVASELQIIEPFIDSIKAPVVEPIPEPIPQKIVTPEVTEKKETAFQIKFRSPDPKELSMLKKTEPVTIASKPTPVVARTEKEIHFRDNYTVVKKPGVFVSRTEATLNNKEVIQTAVKDDRTTQNKVSSGFLEKPDLKIKNDSPIVIEEARPLMVKDAVPFKSRLIPNSSINVKDFLKKDESISRVKEIDNINAKDLKDVQSKPGEPVTNKTEIKINTNEPLKETKAINPSVDNNNLGFQNKSAVPGTSNSDNVLKTNQERKELSKSSPFIEKDIQAPECKPVAPVINKTEINININEPPKETKTINPFVDNYNRNFQNKSAVPLTSKPDIIIKTNGTPKELSKSSPFIEKDEKLIQSNPVSTVVEKFDIKIKTNEPPKELIKKNPIIGQDVKTPESKPVVPVDEKPGIKIGTNELSQEVKTITPLVEKVEKKTEITSTIPIVKESEIKINANELSELKVEINPAVSKVDNKFQRIKSPVDKTNLKIRETSFFEGETKPAVSKIEDKLSIPDAKADVEKVIEVNKLKESINIDEILTKIEEINPDTLIGGLSYDAEIKKLEKASKRKILVAAALFAVLIVSGIFVYQNLQPNPVKAAGEIKNPEKLMVNAQANFVLQNDPEEVTATGEVKGTVENPTQELKKSDAKISLPPLPENLSKEESTYFALNEKSDLINTPIKENNLTAAAKTENIAPPKEDKKIEEEPTIFVAVEEMPELIGGIKGLQSKIVYPEIAKRVGIEGKVIVQAIVDESGNVISVNTLKGIGSGCDEVAMDAVRNSKFTPGKQRGKTVKTQITIPIVFKK